MHEFDRSSACAPTSAWCHCSSCASGMSLMSCGLKGNNQQQVHRVLVCIFFIVHHFWKKCCRTPLAQKSSSEFACLFTGTGVHSAAAAFLFSQASLIKVQFIYASLPYQHNIHTIYVSAEIITSVQMASLPMYTFSSLSEVSATLLLKQWNYKFDSK